MTNNREILALVNELKLEGERLADQQRRDEARMSGERPALVFADSQLAGYRPPPRREMSPLVRKLSKTFGVVAAFGLAVMAYRYFSVSKPVSNPPAAAAASSAPASVTYVIGGAVSPVPASPEAAMSAAAPDAAVSLANRVRPKNLLQTLSAAAGRQVQVLGVETLQLPVDGRPIVGTVVLCAQLEPRTEQRWHEAGLLTKDGINPFLKSVSIANSDSLDLLHDWHVEGVVLDPSRSAR